MKMIHLIIYYNTWAYVLSNTVMNLYMVVGQRLQILHSQWSIPGFFGYPSFSSVLINSNMNILWYINAAIFMIDC